LLAAAERDPMTSGGVSKGQRMGYRGDMKELGPTKIALHAGVGASGGD